VRTNTVIGPGGDAAVLRVRGTDRAIAVKTDCNGRYVALDPRIGGRIAVAEAARNVACTGARPLAITNCLNFGNPTRPEVFFQFTEAVAGIREACLALSTPVTGGNVSFYNESPTGSVHPTPVIGMLGVIDSLEHITRSTFRVPGDAIVLLGDCTAELGGSEYLATVHGAASGRPPECDLDRERAVIATLLEAIRGGVVSSAHDCSDGGLAVAIAECVMAAPDRMMGADVDLATWDHIPLRAVLFGEAQGRILVSSGAAARVLEIAASKGVPARVIGTVTELSSGLIVRTHGKILKRGTEELAEAYHTAIPRIMASTPQSAAIEETDGR
jgi:phosphoribosylformylglycinamidine synthase subunit PurL